MIKLFISVFFLKELIINLRPKCVSKSLNCSVLHLLGSEVLTYKQIDTEFVKCLNTKRMNYTWVTLAHFSGKVWKNSSWNLKNMLLWFSEIKIHLRYLNVLYIYFKVKFGQYNFKEIFEKVLKKLFPTWKCWQRLNSNLFIFESIETWHFWKWEELNAWTNIKLKNLVFFHLQQDLKIFFWSVTKSPSYLTYLHISSRGICPIIFPGTG